jgi:DNA-binding GntR family transcriptional regulator
MANKKPDMTNEIVSILKAEIERGDYGIKGVLPAQAQLTRRFDVSHSTIARVMIILQAMGLVLSHGRNVIANPRRLRIPILTEDFGKFLEEQGCTPHFQYVGDPTIIELNEAFAKEFHLEPGTPSLRRLRLQGEIRDDNPDGKRKNKNPLIIQYRLAETLYRLKDLQELAGDELDNWIEQVKTNSTFNVTKTIQEKTGQKVKHAPAHHHVRFPSMTEQKLLGINLITPVVEQYRVCYNEDYSNILMFNHILYVAPFCSFEYDALIPF